MVTLQVSAVFFGIAVVFIPIGAACLAASAGVSYIALVMVSASAASGPRLFCLQVVEISARYDDTCVTGNSFSERDTNLVQVCDAASSSCVYVSLLKVCISFEGYALMPGSNIAAGRGWNYM